MFDSTPVTLPVNPFDPNIEDQTEEQLLLLRSQIDEMLPVQHLKDLDMERELILQLRAAQALQRSIADDFDIPANQKAQVMNAVSTSLQAISRLQETIYSSERLKRLEKHLVDVLETLPDESVKEFLAKYEDLLNG